MPEERSTRRGRRSPSTSHRPHASPDQVASDLAALEGPFGAWAVSDSPDGDDTDVQSTWAIIEQLVEVAVHHASLDDVRRWTPEQVATVVASVQGSPQLDDDERAETLACLGHLLRFLGDTGRWNGTPEELDAAEDALGAVLVDVEQVGEALAALTAVEPAVEAEALAALPLTHHVGALLDWVRPARPVTGTGALRRSDLPAAAALVGVPIAGARVHSMWDVAHLPDVWVSAEAGGLLDVGRTAARLTPVGEAWFAGTEAQQLEARQRAVVGYWTLALTRDRGFLGAAVGPALTAVLVRSLVRQPVPTDGLGEAVAAVVPEQLAWAAEVVEAQVVDELGRLADLGLVVLGREVDVREGLRPSVVLALTALADEEVDPDVDPDGEVGGEEGSGAGRVYRLKVSLRGASPPVWRRVLVPASTRLGELHEVVQALFAWDDSHLHRFTASGPGRREVVYEPGDLPGGPLGREPSTDERGVPLHRVLSSPGQALTYLYDFGDSWEHTITLEEVLDTPDGSDLPRLLAGRGASPHEDSGGPWGWATYLAEADDPSSEEHEEAREWLELAEGERIDPRVFDRAAAEERLQALRAHRSGR